ncbi:MAG: hypothetical protein JW904_09900 [Spirochaetales bacterium]|nr:hypothetical protein [Spirochaetales bacterium]
MKVAVVIFPVKPDSVLVKLAKALAAGIEGQGHQVDVIDATREPEKKLIIYKYIAIGCEPVSIFGKISERLAPYLAASGAIGGKRSFAFINQTFFGAQKALLNLMRSMENEGMFVKSSYMFKKELIAQEVGRRLHIE